MPRSIRVESPARLHLGFVDLNGDSGRKFGSLGLAITGLSTVVRAERAAAFGVGGTDAARAEKYARAVLRALDLDDRIALDIEQAIPTHCGLGSGTQLALTVAAAITAVYGLDRSAAELARLTARGARSGIGIGVFESGGFVFDGGRAATTEVPPVLARFDFPADWCVILVADDEHQGLSGSAERAAFESTPAMAAGEAAALCRATLMGVFPALVETDFTTFSRSIATIQHAIGNYFGPSQGGQYSSPRVQTAMMDIAGEHGLTGIGQTSWGPTGFAFVDSRAAAEKILESLRDRYRKVNGLHFSVHCGRNHGAVITAAESSRRPAHAAGRFT